MGKREVPLLHEGGADHRTESSDITSPRVIACEGAGLALASPAW